MKSTDQASNETGKPSPTVSVIIPSLHGNRANLNRLTETVLEAGFKVDDVEVLAALGVRPNGRARDVGVLSARGDYLIFMDDDVTFPEPKDLRRLVDFLHDNPDVGLVGPAQQIPPDLDETTQERARQMPRSHVEAPSKFRECDMVTHACMALRHDEFLQVGMEHPNLISGTDPDLRQRFRDFGKKVGIVPNTRVYHPPITDWSTLVTKNFRGGRRSLYVKRNFDEYHLSAEPDISSSSESHREDRILSKVSNHARRFLGGLLRGNVWWLTAQLSYLSGSGYEWIAPEEKVRPIRYPDPPRPDHPDWDAFLKDLREEGDVERLHP